MSKTVLITGASSGLGRGMAVEFARKGYNLALCARRVERLETLKDELEQINASIRVEVLSLDVDNHEQVASVFQAFTLQFGRIDRFIINAGIGKGGPIGTGYFWANKQTAITNFVSTLAQAESAAEVCMKQGSGHIVFISSVSALRGFRGAMTVYAASKAAVSSLAEGMAAQFMGTEIKVTAIHPGYIRTEINEEVEKIPFIVDAETGCKAIVKAIETETRKSFVPGWPWRLVAVLLPLLPLSMLRKLS